MSKCEQYDDKDCFAFELEHLMVDPWYRPFVCLFSFFCKKINHLVKEQHVVQYVVKR